jgi:hypothetical protein
VAKASTLSRFRPVEIGKVDGVRTVIEAVPEPMTSLSGIPMVARVEHKVGLVKELCRRIHDKRVQHLVDHKKFDVALQRACQIAAGFADGNDCDWLRDDAAILIALDRDPVSGQLGASQETVSRFERNALSKTNLRFVNEIFIDHYIAHQMKRPKIVVLDCDGTMMKTYGAQEGSVYRGGNYKHTMYFPLKIFCGDWLVATILRRGDQSEARTILAELKTIVKKLRSRWPRIRVKVRMDSAFCSPGLVEWLKQKRIGYELGLRPTSVLKRYSEAFVEESRLRFVKEHDEPRFIGKDGGKKAQEEHARIRTLPTKERMEKEEEWKRRRTRVVGEFCYQPEKWKKFLKWNEWERVICRCDYTDKGSEVRYIVVSEQYGIPQKLYEEEYCQRGKAEQCIEHFKQTRQRLSAQEFHANQFRLIMSGVAYMLLMHLRNYVPRTLRKADVDTLRKTLILMPMVVRRTDKKRVLEISENHAHRWHFLDTWRRLTAA